MAMGGRAAEELVFAEPTTGASSDIAQATKIARAMVTEFGMSAKLGAVKYGHGDDEPFLGRTYGSGPEYSIEVGSEIDGEVRALIETAHTEAWAVLNTYRDVLDALAGALLEKETLERRDLEVIFAEVEKRPRITAFDEFGQRLPSDRPPIKTPGELAIERGEPWPPPPPVGPDLSKPTQPRPVPVGVAADYPGQAGYNTPKPDPQLTQHQQAPPNWTGGVLPGPLGPYDPGPQGRPANGNQPNGAPPNGGPHGGPHGGSPHGQPPTGHRGQAGWGQTPPPPPTGPVDPHDPWAPPRDRRS
jgi:cell division protease FtsH